MIKVTKTKCCADCGVVVNSAEIEMSEDEWCEEADKHPENYFVKGSLGDETYLSSSDNGMCDDCCMQNKE